MLKILYAMDGGRLIPAPYPRPFLPERPIICGGESSTPPATQPLRDQLWTALVLGCHSRKTLADL
jgi:hypothetical protein